MNDFLNGPASFGPFGNAGPSNAGQSAAFEFATGAFTGNGNPNGNNLMQIVPWVVAAGLAVWIIVKK